MDRKIKSKATENKCKVELYFKTPALAKAFVEMVKQFNPKVRVGKV